jgi:hypothetical protein
MKLRDVIVPVGLILAIAATRVIPHPPNFTPVMSVALFGSAVFFNRYLGIALALAVMAVSDALIGWHSTLPYVYLAMAVAGVLGFLLREKRSLIKTIVVTATSSVLFFIVTNLGVFISQDMYPKTFTGLGLCFAMALPFFKNSLAGDFLFTGVLFSLYYVLGRRTGHNAFAKAA